MSSTESTMVSPAKFRQNRSAYSFSLSLSLKHIHGYKNMHPHTHIDTCDFNDSISLDFGFSTLYGLPAQGNP